jgi:D-threo-aldose 1-dehydrogenase
MVVVSKRQSCYQSSELTKAKVFMQYVQVGDSDLKIPQITFGTSCLGNLYVALALETKFDILRQIFTHMPDSVILDSAGKYGAGLALEVIGAGLRKLAIAPDRVIISNKLGWYRVPLTTPEPSFEPFWEGIEHDAVQKVSYDGIIDCWEQGCYFLGEEYSPQMVAFHDPDEYLDTARNDAARVKLFDDIMDAYEALQNLKEQKLTRAIGVGAKEWRVIREINKEVDLDWVMMAVSFTIYNHPPELVDFMDELHDSGISIINSAVLHSGFLTGGQYFDYRVLDTERAEDKVYFVWREKFFKLCSQFQVLPVDACVQFGISHPAVSSIALNTSKPGRVRQNIRSVTAKIPDDFWQAMKEEHLIDQQFPYAG